MKHILDLFREDNGNLSITRLMFAIGLLWCMSVTTYIVPTSVGNAIQFFSVTAGIFTSLKLIQKGVEKR